MQFNNVSNLLSIPSPVCYNVMQDSQGYIWFSTEAGLCRYDGDRLKVFDKRNGLPEGGTYAIYEFKNMLWLITSKNRILVYKNGVLQEPTLSKEYVKMLNSDFAITYRMDVKDNSTVFINTRLSTYEFNIHTKQIKPYKTEKIETSFLFLKTERQIIPIANRVPRPNDDINVTILNNGNNKKIKLSNTLSSTYWRVESCRIGEYDFISCNNFLIRLDKDLNHTVLELPNRILSLQGDKDNGLWAGIYKGGVYYYPDINDLSFYKRGLENISVSGVCQDRENNVWCSTLEKGIYFCHNKNITDYSNIKPLKNVANLLKYEGGNLFVASSGVSLFKIDGKVQEYRYKDYPSYLILDIIKYGDGWITTGYGRTHFLDKNFQLVSEKVDLNKCPHYIEAGPNNDLVGVSYGEFQHIINGKIFKSYTFSFEYSARCVLYDSKGNVFVGSDIGLHRVDLDNYNITHIKRTEKISKIIEDSQGNIWLPTKGTGLFVMTDTGTYQINKLFKIPTDIFYDITEDKNKNIWLATNIGLIKLEKQENGFQTYIYNTRHGLPSNVIYKVAADNKEIYLSSTEGLTSFPLDVNLLNTTPPNIYVNSITASGKDINISSDSYVFPYDANSISVTFDVATYKDLGNGNSLFYKLKGRDSHYNVIQGNTIVMDNLKPGKYQLEVYAVNNDGIKSEKPILISITVKKPYWKTVWFIVLAVIVFGGLLYISIKKRIGSIRENEERKTQINKMMAEYQLSALQAQMNPHFIFNAINSIQSYILRKDEEQAYEYLAKFSKLIRMVLNNSDEKILSLQQELDTLDLYIQLEKLRFDNKFEYRLEIDENVKPQELMVPAMLIQPYVENAIWHGLMNLDDIRKGVLTIKISEVDNFLRIWVEDNGVGRKFTMEARKLRSHRSIGMKLGEKRLMMLSQLKDFEKARVSVIDLFDKDGKASGTRIEIYLPINWA